LETLDSGEMELRLVRLCHAIDHLKRLHEDLQEAPLERFASTRCPAAEVGATVLAAWLDAQKESANGAQAPEILHAIATASQQLAGYRKSEREKILGALALQQTSASAADQALQSLQWADNALDHARRSIDSLRTASGQ
jgi:phosphate:Na+ symporter